MITKIKSNMDNEFILYQINELNSTNLNNSIFISSRALNSKTKLELSRTEFQTPILESNLNSNLLLYQLNLIRLHP